MVQRHIWELPDDVIMLRKAKQAFLLSLKLASVDSLSLQVKTPSSIQVVKETVLFHPLVSAGCIR